MVIGDGQRPLLYQGVGQPVAQLHREGLPLVFMRPGSVAKRETSKKATVVTLRRTSFGVCAVQFIQAEWPPAHRHVRVQSRRFYQGLHGNPGAEAL